MDGKKLLELAIQARKNAYVPYSNFQVGAAVLTKNGEVILGCNVENASYGLCNCAERTALFTAVSKGYSVSDFVAIAIASGSNPAASPCGACRQVICELMPQDAKVYYGNTQGEFHEFLVKDLLPNYFNKESLK